MNINLRAHDKYVGHVDHDHVTDQIRGILCGACNRSLGLVKDSVEILQRMINYLHITSHKKED